MKAVIILLILFSSSSFAQSDYFNQLFYNIPVDSSNNYIRSKVLNDTIKYSIGQFKRSYKINLNQTIREIKCQDIVIQLSAFQNYNSTSFTLSYSETEKRNWKKDIKRIERLMKKTELGKVYRFRSNNSEKNQYLYDTEGNTLAKWKNYNTIELYKLNLKKPLIKLNSIEYSNLYENNKFQIQIEYRK